MNDEGMRVYLGDGVYAQLVDGMIRLTSENGISVLDEIFLEPEVLEALIKFAQFIR